MADNQAPIAAPALQFTKRTAWFSVAVAAIVLIARRAIRPAAVLVVIWAGALELYTLAKNVVDRPRPPMHLWLTSVSSSSSLRVVKLCDFQ